MVFSVTEGEDKPVKYPHMFQAAALVIINKIDLLPYLDFDLANAANLNGANPTAPVLLLSARTGPDRGDMHWPDRRECGGVGLIDVIAR